MSVTTPGVDLLLDSLQRRMRTMHSLYYQAVGSMGLDHVKGPPRV